MFYNVYIKQGLTPPAATMFAGLDSQPLYGFEKLHLVEAGVAWDTEPTVLDMADGTGRVVEETLKFACGTLDVSKAKYAAMRTTYHNRICTIAIFDPHGLRELTIFRGVLMKIYVVAESGDVVRIKFVADRKAAPSTMAGKVIEVVSILDFNDFIYLEGHIYNTDDEALHGAFVGDGIHQGEMETGTDGSFFGFVYEYATELVIQCAGYEAIIRDIEPKINVPLLGLEYYMDSE